MIHRLAFFVSASMFAAAAAPLAESGFDHFYNLEYDEALAAFRAEVAQNPDSPDAYNHLAQTILYRELFRSGALESQLVSGSNPFLRRAGLNIDSENKQEFESSIARAISLVEGRLKTNPKDTGALYSLGVTYGLRANYHFLVEKAYMDALRDATTGRNAHNRATEIDPSLTDARLVQGVYDYVLGSLPRAWKMLGFMAGFHGDRARAIATLQTVAQNGRLNRVDAEVLLCAIYRRERRPKDAVLLLNDLVEQFPRNYLFRFELVQMYGDLGQKDNALSVIREIEKLKSNHASGFDKFAVEKLRYARGNLLFWYNDLDLALDDMKAVTAKAYDLDLNTGVYSWLRLGQIYDLKGQRELAKKAYLQTVAFAPNSDASSEAQNYLLSRYKR